MSKGSARRPGDTEAFADGWERIWGEKTKGTLAEAKEWLSAQVEALEQLEKQEIERGRRVETQMIKSAGEKYIEAARALNEKRAEELPK